MDQPVQPKNCPACGKPSEPNWKSCPYCGCNFEKGASVPVKVKPSATTSGQKPPVSQKKGMPTWGWLLIILGGAGCVILTIVILGITGVLLLKPKSSSGVIVPTAAVVMPGITTQGDLPPGDNPSNPGGSIPSVGFMTEVPAADKKDIEVVDTWYAQDPTSPTYLLYGCVIQNPNPEIALTNVELQSVAYDSDGAILATGNVYVYVLLPNEQAAVNGSGGMIIPEGKVVKSVKFSVTDQGKATTFNFQGSPFEISDINYFEDPNYPLVTGMLTNKLDVGFGGVMITAIAYDTNGKIIGGSNNYNDVYVPANAKIPVMTDLKVSGNATSVKMFASFNASMQVFEDESVGLPTLVDFGTSVDEYGTLRYTAILENPSNGLVYQYLTGRLIFYDTSGKLIGGTQAQIDTVFPGNRAVVSSSTMLAHMHGKYEIGKVEYYPNRPFQYFDMNGLEKVGITSNPLSTDQIQIYPGEYETKVTAMLHNSSDVKLNSKVIAVLYDADGKIIGGGEGYPPEIGGGGAVAVEISIYQNLTPAKVEVYTAIVGVPQ
jgi:hypothetical protein